MWNCALPVKAAKTVKKPSPPVVQQSHMSAFSILGRNMEDSAEQVIHNTRAEGLFVEETGTVIGAAEILLTTWTRLAFITICATFQTPTNPALTAVVQKIFMMPFWTLMMLVVGLGQKNAGMPGMQ